MVKEEFIAIGIDEELALLCEDASQEELKSYVPIERFDEVNQLKIELENVIERRDTELDSLEKSNEDVENLKSEILQLQEDKVAIEEEYRKEINNLKIENAIESAIIKAKGKNVKAIKGVLDIQQISIDENGEVIGIENQIKQLLEDEESKFLFNVADEVTLRGVSPAKSEETRGITKNDFEKMSYKERVELYKNNEELYKELNN